MTSLAEQDIVELGGRSSVLARQKRDHQHLDALLNQLAGLDPARQGPVLLRIYRLVFPHAFAEESVLWPTIRRRLPDGEQLTLRVELEHQAINELAVRLEGLQPTSPERQAVLERMVALLRQDVRDEEDVLLAGLQSRLSSAELQRLGWAWEAVRRLAPTRPHPMVSRRPPGNVLAALPLSAIDRLRDRVDAGGLRHGAAGAAPWRALSSGLARASRAVERLPVFGIGEHPATHRRPPYRGGALLALALTAAAATTLVVVARRRRAAGRIG